MISPFDLFGLSIKYLSIQTSGRMHYMIWNFSFKKVYRFEIIMKFFYFFNNVQFYWKTPKRETYTWKEGKYFKKKVNIIR